MLARGGSRASERTATLGSPSSESGSASETTCGGVAPPSAIEARSAPEGARALERRADLLLATRAREAERLLEAAVRPRAARRCGRAQVALGLGAECQDACSEGVGGRSARTPVGAGLG